MTLLDKYLLEVREREGKATPGPWVTCRYHQRLVEQFGSCHCHGDITYATKSTDAPFIAHARTDMPRLVKLLELATRALRIIKEDGSTKHGTPSNYSAITADGALAELDRLTSGEK